MNKKPSWNDASNCTVSIARKVASGSMDEVLSALPKNGDGWIMYPDRVEAYGSQPSDGAPILAGDIVDATGISYAIRYDGELWDVWTYREDEDGSEHRVYREQYAALSNGARHPIVDGTMTYATYWRLESQPMSPDDEDPITVWRPFASRLVERKSQASRS